MKEEALKLEDELPPVLWANPKTEIHGIVDVRTYPLEGFIPLCLKQDADDMIRRLVDRMVELESCLDFAVQDTMDYINLNNLGGENNHWLVWARKLLVNTTPQTKPLSDEETMKEWDKAHRIGATKERHGIK